MRTRLIVAGLLLLGGIQPGATAEKARVELMPFIGYQLGGELDIDSATGASLSPQIQEAGNYGFFLSFPLPIKGGAAGAMYVRQDTSLDTDPLAGVGETDMRVEYFHFEGRYTFRRGAVRPLVSASVGITRFEPLGFDSVSRFSSSVGGGVLLLPAEHLGFRLEGRWYGTLVDRDHEEICADDDEDICLDFEQSTVESQFDVKGGLVLSF
jgi:hypothetical protein